MNTATRNQTATFWKYDGNHHNGKDYERKDDHKFGLDLIAYVAYVGDGGDYFKPLTYEHTKQIKTIHSKRDSFGHEVKVSAPAEIWAIAKTAYNAYRKESGFDA